MQKVLIVEDNKIVREEIALLLNDKGYKTYQSSSVDTAVSIIEKHAPNVILSDINMSELTGYDLLNKVQEINYLNHKYVFIFVSAKNSMEDVRHGMKLGADDYIIKPFNTEDIINSISVRLKKLKNYN